MVGNLLDEVGFDGGGLQDLDQVPCHGFVGRDEATPNPIAHELLVRGAISDAAQQGLLGQAEVAWLAYAKYSITLQYVCAITITISSRW